MSALAVPEAAVYDRAEYEKWSQEMQEEIVLMDTMLNCTPFIVGDKINDGVERFGDDLAFQVFDPAEHPIETLQNWSWVAKRFPPEKRINGARFTLYQSLAGIKKDEDRFGALNKAIESGWTREDAREYVKSLKGKTEKEKPETISLEKAPLLAFFDEVQKVLDTAKVSKHTQAVEHYLNSMVDRKVWGA